MTEPSPSPGALFTILCHLLVSLSRHLQGFALSTGDLWALPGAAWVQPVSDWWVSVCTYPHHLGTPLLSRTFHVSVLCFHPAQDSPPFPSAGRRQEDSQVMVYSALRIPPED